MNNLQSLRMLVKLKKRRLEQLDEALNLSRRKLKEQMDGLASVLGEQAHSQAVEDEKRARLMALVGGEQSFRPNDLVTLQHLLSEAEQMTAEAGKRVRHAEQQVGIAQQQSDAALRAYQRGEQQLQACQQRLEQALATAQAEQDDQQDEEAEDASVARLLAAQRSAAAAAQQEA
ncbi:type III secretion protein [Hydrogenophaga soli]|nr:type III secretion protein [Burkholderiaceae bacterium]